jgi:hypothetical protein
MKDAQITSLAEFILVLNQLFAETHEAEDRQLYESYLSHAGIILAKVIQGQAIGHDIDTMEHLFGNTWLKDEAAYSEAYAAWDRFKGLFRQSIHGMTVNERLFALGLLKEFEDAVAKEDSLHMRSILRKCFIDDKSIQAIVDKHTGKKS